jgi:hypothetical protein
MPSGRKQLKGCRATHGNLQFESKLMSLVISVLPFNYNPKQIYDRSSYKRAEKETDASYYSTLQREKLKQRGKSPDDNNAVQLRHQFHKTK